MASFMDSAFMDSSELDDLENSVQDLLSLAKVELAEKRLQQERETRIQAEVSKIQARLTPLLEQVEAMLEQLNKADCSESATRTKLEAKAADLRQRLADAPELAAQTIDRQILLQEERLLDEQLTAQANHWRQALKVDLMEMIAEQTDFFSATDAAIAIRAHVHDLKAINALEEVVDALISQINTHSEEGPVARLRGSHEQTLGFIYNKALENRARVDHAPNVQPRVRHRSSEKRPNPYSQLEGKVVIFGGHDRLETAIRNRLREANVTLIWCTAQAGPQIAEQTEAHIATADVTLILTGYTSHKLTDKAIQAAQRSGRPVEMINTTGVVRVLEAIEYGLKSKQLARHLNQFSKPA